MVSVHFAARKKMKSPSGSQNTCSQGCNDVQSLVTCLDAGESTVPEDLDNAAWQKYLSRIPKQSKYLHIAIVALLKQSNMSTSNKGISFTGLKPSC